MVGKLSQVFFVDLEIQSLVYDNRSIPFEGERRGIFLIHRFFLFPRRNVCGRKSNLVLQIRGAAHKTKMPSGICRKMKGTTKNTN